MKTCLVKPPSEVELSWIIFANLRIYRSGSLQI